MGKPDRLLIQWEIDDERFGDVGRYEGDNQFLAFVTGAFPADWWTSRYPAEYSRLFWKEHKRWYAVLHRFDADGEHIGSEVRCGGTTAEGESNAMDQAESALSELLETLGKREYCDIHVRPFGVTIDGYFFGLVYECVNAEDPEAPDAKNEYVMLQPNNIMFHPPWDSGEYSS